MPKSWIERESVPRDKVLYDSNILIAYLFAEKERFDKAKKVLRKYSNRFISMLSIHEISYYSKKMSIEERFIDIKPKLNQLVKPLAIDQEVCLQASHLRVAYGLPEIDALIAATAVRYDMNYFYTFDEDFGQLHNKKIQNTRIIKL